jgi:hypothetical protein
MIKQETINEICETHTGAALYVAGYRLHTDGHWRKLIDSAACGLTPAEQEINARGGRDYGTDANVILGREIADAKARLAEYADDEIEASSELYWLRSWLKDATQ